MAIGGREAMHDLIGVAAAVAAIEIYRHFLPNMSDIRTATPFNTDIETAERQALFASSAFVLVTAGLSRSLEVFIVGGLAVIMLDYATKHANAVHPDTGKMAAATPTATGLSESYPMPDYANVG